ncbi:hypothetical protein AB0912_10015 [Streptomyces sp. NPDC007084]|uniref:hypothetical protein n=1 Tax=Streptomyces sp. NPDC007084 TaxID=3154313 RepID=UPI0034571292
MVDELRSRIRSGELRAGERTPTRARLAVRVLLPSGDIDLPFPAPVGAPPVKLYLLNGAEALFAYYAPARREEEVDYERLQLYDVQGTRSTLFSFDQGAEPRDTASVEQSRLWFDALWETISSELLLSG